MDQEFYMMRAINLANKGIGNVSPNPMVGCVIVKNGEVVSSGYHQQFGKAHAEVNAINALNPEINPADCILYVTLEPCTHFGKTPPCTDLIIEKGFKKVVICNTDPNPLVAGKGIEKLRAAGTEVVKDVLGEQGAELNKRFFTYHQKKRPYYILKWAQTADGFISRWPVPENREENMISTSDHLLAVHKMRSEEMAIMVGKNTVLHDNPRLTTRLVKGNNPIRIFIDRILEVPLTFNIYNSEAKTIIFNEQKSEVKEHLHFIRIDFSKNVLIQISEKLYDLNIQSVLVEGGARLLNDFILQGLYDELRVFKNYELHFGSGIQAPNAGNHK